jgi:predicted nucleic acid-binding protein
MAAQKLALTFVDTSIWVDALRGRDRDAVARLGHLLDEERVALAAPVRLELLSGASRSTLPGLRRVLSALPLYLPGEETWRLLDAWIERAVAEGERFGVGDLLIAAIATECGGVIWSRDSDFRRMERLGFVGLYAA